MTKDNKIKWKENVWFLFCLLFILSSMDITYASVIKYATIIGMEILCFFDIIFKQKNNIPMHRRIFITNIIIIFLMILSCFFSMYIKNSILKVIVNIDFLVFVIILLPMFLKDISRKKMYSIPLVAFSIILLYANIFYANDYVITINSGRMGGNSRFYAGFGHPNILAFFTFINSIFVVILFSLYKKDMKKTEKYIYYFCAILSVYTMIRSDSRTAIYSFILFVLLYSYKKIALKSKIIKIITISGICIICLLTIFRVDGVDFDNLDIFFSYRLSHNNQAIDELKKENRLLLGIGGFNYSNIESLDVEYLDMAYISLVYQFGIITLVFILIFLYQLYCVIRNIDFYGKNAIMSLFLIFLVYNFSENLIFNLSNFFSIFMYMIIFYEFYNYKNKQLI